MDPFTCCLLPVFKAGTWIRGSLSMVKLDGGQVQNDFEQWSFPSRAFAEVADEVSMLSVEV